MADVYVFLATISLEWKLYLNHEIKRKQIGSPYTYSGSFAVRNVTCVALVGEMKKNEKVNEDMEIVRAEGQK